MTLFKNFRSLITIAPVALLCSCNLLTGTGATTQASFYTGISYSLANSAVTVSSSQIAAGKTATITLSLTDQNQNAFISALPVVTFSQAGGTSTGTIGAVTNNNDGTYTATFTASTTPGTATTIYAQVNNQAVISSLPTIQITYGAAAKLIFVQQPTSTTYNTVLSPAITVAAQDSYGNRVTNYSTPVTIAITAGLNPGSGTLSGTLAQTPSSNGIATFNDLSINNVGNGYELTATSGSLNAASTAAFSSLFNLSYASFSFNWLFNSSTWTSATIGYTSSNTSTLTVGSSPSSNSQTVAYLAASNQKDQDDTSSGFGGGILTGGALWDSTFSFMRLGTSNPNLELDSSWTPAWSNLIAYWKLNETLGTTGSGSVVDSVGIYSGTPTSVTFGGSGKLNTSASLTGSNSYISTSSNSNLTPAALTISFWINPTILPTNGNVAGVIDKRDDTGGTAGYLVELYNNSGTQEVYVALTNPSILFVNYTLPLSNWTHIAFTFSGGAAAIYINGTQVASTTGLLSLANYNVPLLLGARQDGNYFNGSLDDVAIWNTALSPSAIQTIYQHESAKYAGTATSRVMDAFSTGQSWTSLSWVTTLPFFKSLPGSGTSETSSTYSSLSASLMNGNVALWHLDEPKGTTGAGSVIDSSGQTNTGTPTNVTFGQNGKLGLSAQFNGTSSYINISKNTDLSSAWTVAAWANPTALNSSATLVSNSFNTTVQYNLGASNGVTTWSAGYYNAGWVTSPTFTPTIGKWYHVVGTYQGGSSPSLTLYINGTSIGTTTAGVASSIASGGLGSHIGGNWNNTFYFAGNIDEVGLWSRALSAPEVLELYRRGANRVYYQVQTCPDSACASPTPSPGWLGPDGTTQSYFSELYNTVNNYLPAPNTTPAAAPSPVASGGPTMTFSNFTSVSIPTNRYFQYRAIMETDDGNTLCNYGSGAKTAPCSPELQSVTVGPTHYDNTSPSIIGNQGVPFHNISSFLETLGAGGCNNGSVSDAIVYNLSTDKSSWKYWNGSAWATANGTTAQANSASVINTNAASFAPVGTVSTVYFKAFLKSSGITQCELNSLGLGGTQ